jgi:hypothetical protein
MEFLRMSPAQEEYIAAFKQAVFSQANAGFYIWALSLACGH